jgi:hypothetical protein
LERALGNSLPEQRQELLTRLDDIENGVNTMKVPVAFADQFYVLREHIGFVRRRLTQQAAAGNS